METMTDKTVTVEVASEVAPVVTPEMEADAAWRAGMSEMLAKVQAERAKDAYTLPELLGEPVPYEPIPGLYFKRPKLGYKMDMVRRFQAVAAKFEGDKNQQRDVLESLDVVRPYLYMENADGKLEVPTLERLVFEAVDDGEEVSEIYLTLISSSRRADKEKASPNE